ncbi:MAG: hypothetical protein Q8896_06965, partial [Bacteroidota bacterium]|nr:hypothetical protein [Bacteroidota bacterium]
NYDHWEYSADDLDNLQFLSDSLLFYTYKSAGLYPGDCHSYAATAEISNDSIIHVRRTWPVYFSFDGSVGLPRTRQVVVEFGGCDEPITLFSSLISPTLDGNSAFPGISFRGRAGRCDADGTRLLTVGNDSIYLWNIADGSLLKSYAGHYGACKPIGFSQNGMYFFTFGVSDSSVRVWETASGNNTKTYRPYLLNPSTAILTPNGDNIIVGYDDGTIVDLDIGPDLSIGSKPPNPTAEVSLSCVPNPISASSIITFRIYRPSSVRITLSSVLGIELCTLYDGFSDGNEEKLPISSKVDIGGYSKGIYLMTIRSASERRTLKVLKMD